MPPSLSPYLIHSCVCVTGPHGSVHAAVTREKPVRRCVSECEAASHRLCKLQHHKKCMPLANQSNVQRILIHTHRICSGSRKQLSQDSDTWRICRSPDPGRRSTPKAARSVPFQRCLIPNPDIYLVTYPNAYLWAVMEEDQRKSPHPWKCQILFLPSPTGPSSEEASLSTGVMETSHMFHTAATMAFAVLSSITRAVKVGQLLGFFSVCFQSKCILAITGGWPLT